MSQGWQKPWQRWCVLCHASQLSASFESIVEFAEGTNVLAQRFDSVEASWHQLESHEVGRGTVLVAEVSRLEAEAADRRPVRQAGRVRRTPASRDCSIAACHQLRFRLPFFWWLACNRDRSDTPDSQSRLRRVVSRWFRALTSDSRTWPTQLRVRRSGHQRQFGLATSPDQVDQVGFSLTTERRRRRPCGSLPTSSGRS